MTEGNGAGFLAPADHTPEAQVLYDDDLEEPGFVMNVSRLWAYQPATVTELFALMSRTLKDQGLSYRDRGILITASVSTLGDSYCSIAWGKKLAVVSDPELVASVLRGEDSGLTDRERALAVWARKVARDPSGTAAKDVQELRDAGWADPQIFAITVYVALRLAFSTMNGALGASPDANFRTTAPDAVLEAVTYGRPIDNPA